MPSKEGTMQIMIECWRTGHAISTGIETDAKTFAGLSDFEAQTYCPYCKRNHRWSKSDVCADKTDLHAPQSRH
jgi:hypothetical protein